MSNEPRNPRNLTPKQKRALQEKRWQRKRQWNDLRFSVLSLFVLGIFFSLIIVFLIVFPRSKVSEIENRTLAAFPKFTLSSYFSGEYTAGIATWFDDTVPYRDEFKNFGYSFKSLFGTASENTITYINQDVVANDMNAPATPTPEASGAPSAEPSPTPEPDQKDFTAEDAEFDMTNGLLVVNQDGHWKCLGLFGGGSGTAYAEALNSLQEKVGPGVKIYSMPCPLASQFYVPSNAADYTRDQSETFDSVAEKLDPKITSINICSVLAKHTEENIYLRTDHHWAPLGAYYAARTFAETAGVPFAELDTYTKGTNEGYVGTMYAYSQDSRILNDPEDFDYYVPSNQYRTFYYDSSFNYQYEDDLILDMPTEASYLMFMGGDDKIVKIKTDVNNDRKLLIIKDSYGNAEIPFYTGSFEEIYVTDMRYFNCNLVNFIQDLGITDVLYTMCSYSVVGSNADSLSTLLTQYADQRIKDEEPAITAEKDADAAREAAEEARATQDAAKPSADPAQPSADAALPPAQTADGAQ